MYNCNCMHILVYSGEEDESFRGGNSQKLMSEVNVVGM